MFVSSFLLKRALVVGAEYLFQQELLFLQFFSCNLFLLNGEPCIRTSPIELKWSKSTEYGAKEGCRRPKILPGMAEKVLVVAVRFADSFFAMYAKKPRIETCFRMPKSPTLHSFRQVSATGSML